MSMAGKLSPNGSGEALMFGFGVQNVVNSRTVGGNNVLSRSDPKKSLKLANPFPDTGFAVIRSTGLRDVSEEPT